ncbi:hypothetical protein PR048_006534 [Dryococelus australis]|uniref:Transposase n=1 Tax=Dryococelus australis TaxID=614101 RepID=A0ABQ9IDH3_9NEOP|nr:hypothetical protein PR048_006534 [Dryococelus australis]
MDERGLPLNNRPLRIIAQRKNKEAVSLTKCCNADGSYVSPLVIFKGVIHRPGFTDHLTSGSIVAMSESGYVNKEYF